MLAQLLINTVALAGIILLIFSISIWITRHVVVEVTKKQQFSQSPIIGTLAVAAYFTVALAVIVLFFKHLPGVTGAFLTVVFTLITYRFFVTFFSATGSDAEGIGIRLLAATGGIAITLLWTLYPNWFTIDIAATLVAITVLVMLGGLSLQTVTIIAIGVMLYDIVAVFVTGQMMEAAGAAKSMPMLFIIPKSFALGSAPAQMLGLGDVVIPGAVILAALRKDIPRAYILTLIGYFVGLLVAIAVVYVTRVMQPATIYLVPGVLTGLLIAAYRSGMLKQVFAPEE
ncbi:MAG: hypothetical protein A3D65_00960 [Candidatus Lloydbacteria bacterium RIFCSPHIGHO2_02_FULL_50_13]|uniref:Uncharacterized protein n=1 Tax=Candidatus Lloydbacteria bacterium RIFCSPHIGHO2_02_FULL_50_13 TaxID=1798661 RepID=A0A1G2CZJ4_9BACT|nr:MAG: hypothetical protein A3D65_00960 [Candidatus Lloydbacteria bacterium RIFCSPHIGHO2_02_FULL_50_13]